MQPNCTLTLFSAALVHASPKTRQADLQFNLAGDSGEGSESEPE